MFAMNSTILHSVVGEDNQLVAGAIGVGAILATTVIYFALKTENKKHEFPKLPGIQLFHAWNFFGRRHDFLQSNFKRTSGSFSFNALQHNVIALTGEEGRQAFFTNPYLDIGEGVKLLVGVVRVFAVQLRSNVLISVTLGPQDRRCGYSDRQTRGKCEPPHQEI